MTITAAADDYDRIVFGQIKNNLAARIMHSLHYHMTIRWSGTTRERHPCFQDHRRAGHP